MMATGPDPPLQGARVLIVEDRYLIATEVAEQVTALGGRVVGPSRSVQAARLALANDGADIALLDVNLEDDDVFPLAAELDAAGVPFAFITGYDRDLLPPRWRDRPRLGKPISSRALGEELLRLCGASASAPSIESL